MFQTKRISPLCLTAAALVLSVLGIGCGGGSSNSGSMSNSSSLSPAQAQAVTDQVVQALTQALGTTFSSNATVTENPRPRLSTVVRDIRPDALSGCTSTSTGETCNFTIPSSAEPCSGPQGGTISVSGDIDGTLNNSGSGSVSANLTITPTNCSVSNLIVNGDPNILVTGQVNFTANETPVFPITFMETGGISYGPSPSGSCQLNVAYTINNASLSCTVSGTVCGQSVNGSC